MEKIGGIGEIGCQRGQLPTLTPNFAANALPEGLLGNHLNEDYGTDRGEKVQQDQNPL